MDAALLVQYKALSAPTLTLPDTLFSTFWLFPSFLLKINAFTMRYEIWKGREKKKVRPIGQRQDRTTGRSRQKDITCDLPSAPLELILQLTLLCFFWFFLYLDWQMSRPVSGE